MKKDSKIKMWMQSIKNSERGEKIREVLRKTGYGKVMLLLVAGVLLLLLSLPGEKKKEDSQKEKQTRSILGEESTQEENRDAAYAKELEQKLEQLLGQVEGVGQVQVMITLKSSSETVVNKDISQSESSSQRPGTDGTGEQEAQSQSEEETVLVEDSEGNQTPYVIKEMEPEIAGIVVICDGGDDPVVVSNITSAAEVLFSVSAHKVKVMKKI
ncbi:MAG: stage III sporulation protein AG [Lachnospiraceae bacterium]|nr:stage III sporulation protein AG [Lachnospiraceae bacterium]